MNTFVTEFPASRTKKAAAPKKTAKTTEEVEPLQVVGGRVLQLVPRVNQPALPNEDVVEALEELLSDARKGKVVGLALGVMLNNSQFWVDTAGEAHRNPGFSLQMTRMLDDHLVALVRRGG